MLEEFGTEIKEEKKTNDKNDCVEERPTPEEKETDKLKKTQWAVIGSKEYAACSSTAKKLPPGMYGISWTPQYGSIFLEQTLNTDDLIDFPDTVFDLVIKEIENFWKLNETFNKYGFLHRRGYLIYGPAGGGKSCLVSRICKNIIENGGIVFECKNRLDPFFNGLALFRIVEPERQIICIFEDIDAIVEEKGESAVLSLLDGENQVDRVINIATTNYPERLDKRIVSRPRRFDRIIKIGMPSEDIRKIFFNKKLKLNGNDVKKWVKASEGLSFAALAEMVIGIKCLKNDFDEVVSRLKDMTNKKISSSEYDRVEVGFKKGG